MEKQQLILEHPLHSRSSSIIWQLISTAGGLKKWVADDATEQKDRIQFIWGDPWRHQEIRTATILNKVKNKSITLRWDDETDDQATDQGTSERVVTDGRAAHAWQRCQAGKKSKQDCLYDADSHYSSLLNVT